MNRADGLNECHKNGTKNALGETDRRKFPDCAGLVLDKFT